MTVVKGVFLQLILKMINLLQSTLALDQLTSQERSV